MAGEGLHEPAAILSAGPAGTVILASGTVVIGLLALFGLESSLGSAAHRTLESLFALSSVAGLTGPTPSFGFLPALITLVIVAVGVLAASQFYISRRFSAEKVIGDSPVRWASTGSW